MKPLQELISLLSRNRANKIETGPLLEYFKPLYEWLKEENKESPIGWKSNNPMKCP